jgi:transcriptional regulator with XRE-family HTH domain
MYQTSYNKNWYGMSDNAIVDSICANLKQMRLNKNISQEQLSSMSGVNRVTISRMESGQAINLMTMIQLLRALEQLHLLSEFNVVPEISPIMVMEAQEKYRKKASSPRTKKL